MNTKYLMDNNMLIAIIYFSATNNTEKIKDVIKDELIKLNNEVKDFNLADRKVRENLNDFELYDAIIFGFPIYYWRAPRLVREWLIYKEGNNSKCSVFFTYGGVNTGIAHYNINHILNSKNFKMVISAEFLAKHTFNFAGFQFMEDRPNDEDFRIAREFAFISYRKFLEENIGPLSFDPPVKSEEEIDKIEKTLRRATPTPFIDGDLCTDCGLCEKVCPTDAMEIKKGKAKRKKCIRCLRCLFSCPEHAIIMPDMSSQYKHTKNSLRLTDEVLESKKSKIYS
ncbi:MAG: 4Fe-4S dicluster domain-containing protein [Promethearchaeota archaeon]|nr:MAG: 4Fe-4S dicluster domain-containing protein [Candidatus Lokiarchaeota archaeon]